MSSPSVTPGPLVNPFTESLSVLFAGALVSLCSRHFASTGAVQKTVAGITQLQKFPVGTISHGRKSTVVSSSSAPRSAIFLKTERGHSLGTPCLFCHAWIVHAPLAVVSLIVSSIPKRFFFYYKFLLAQDISWGVTAAAGITGSNS